MGQLTNGKWGEDQAFAAGPHHNSLGSEEFPFSANETGRYHLYISHSCPFAHRSLIALYLKKLNNSIGVSHVNPLNTENGWTFDTNGFTAKDDIMDKVLGKKLLHEVYTAADSKYTGRVTVPLLIDTKPSSHSLGGDGQIRIVSNESAEIVDIFNGISSSGPDFSKHADEQKSVQELVQNFTGSVFKLGKVTNQQQYDTGIDQLYKAIDVLEAQLDGQKFLASNDEPTTADVLAFPFFVRFDPAYALVFQATRARLSDYPNLGVYLRRFYQINGISDTINLEHLIKGTFSKLTFDKFVAKKEEIIVPAVPRLNWDQPVE